MKTYKNYTAFTLIELLVVITIIGILAGIALPVYSNIQVRGEQTKALANAKQIGLALKLYATDNNGNYPTDGSKDPATALAVASLDDANAAFRFLIPNYVPNEAPFWVSGSGWSTLPDGPDENIGGDFKLAGGENHWAYVKGLRETSLPRLPLLADGFSASKGVYAASGQGGLWKGSRAIIIRVDQSGALENLNASFIRLESHAGVTPFNIFTQAANWLNTVTPPAVAMNPADPPTPGGGGGGE